MGKLSDVSHVRMAAAHPAGPPVGCVGTIGLTMPKTHEDMPDVYVGIFDWDGVLAGVASLPRGTWIFTDEDVEPVPCGPSVCTCPRDRAPARPEE